MRTTLNLNDQLLADAKAFAAQQRTSLTRLIEEGLQLRMRTPAVSTHRARVRLPVQLAPLGPEWPTLRQLCIDKQLSGNDLPDAWLSAAVTHQSEHLVSFDRDFRRLLKRGQFTLLKAE